MVRSPKTRRPRIARRGEAAALLLVLAATGCVRRAPPADLSTDPAALLEAVERTQARVERVQGEAKVKVDAPGGGGTVTQLVAAERPDRLRLDTLDFFGNPAAVLVADAGRFALLDLRAGVFYRGAATPENVHRLVPLAVPVPELVLLLCGAVPLDARTPRSVEPGDGVLRLELAGEDRVQRLDVGEGAAIHGSTLAALPGRSAPTGGYDVSFDRFRARGGRPFPGKVRVDASAAAVHLDLTWKEIEVNGVIPEGSFSLTPPPGVRIVELDGDR
jgi:hypothetical protein